MWHTLIDESLADGAVGSGSGRSYSRDFCFFQLTVLAVGQKVVGIASAHDAGPSESESHARWVNCDPTPPPLLGYVRGGPRAAGWIYYEVAWVGRHEQASFNNAVCRLHYIH